jgi:serine/threonine protein kinase
MENLKLAGDIVADQFKLDKLITSDSLNQIWEAVNFKSSRKERVTLKFEDVKFEPKLKHECSVYMHFESQPNIKGQSFPKVLDYLTIENENIMITENLGPNLEQLFEYCNRKFSLKTVLMLASQMLKRLEYVHSCRLIHRDVKPKNFRIGSGIKHHLLYMTNFRNAMKYMSSKGKHLKFRDGTQPTGTMRYTSINAHVGIECSRRDDMESLAYVLIYLLKGELPWQN